MGERDQQLVVLLQHTAAQGQEKLTVPGTRPVIMIAEVTFFVVSYTSWQGSVYLAFSLSSSQDSHPQNSPLQKL